MSYQPKRPLALRDVLRIHGMHARCDTCRACPTVLATLSAMQPPDMDATSPIKGRVLRLAG